MEVGVVVPARGPAPFLEEALAAILAERPASVVVVDDGSDPPLAPSAPVEVVRRPVAGGPAAARNAGVAALPDSVAAVAFCDADDVWGAGSLAPRVAALAADPELAGVFGRARIVDPAGRPTGEAWPMPDPPVVRGVAALYERNPILLSSVVLRRDACLGFDESLTHAEDWELWLRLLDGGRALRAVPEAEVVYRRHPGGLTAGVLALALGQREVHERYAGRVPEELRSRAARADAAAVAAGLLRERRWAQARAAMAPGPRRVLAAVPGVRLLLGRRDPYRRG